MLDCIIYLAVTGLLFFAIGRFLPKQWFNADQRLFRCRRFERGGSVYERLKIKSWQNKLPDMSRIFPCVMPRKELCKSGITQLPRMIQETCVAELTHALLCVSGLYCVSLWSGTGGVIMAILNVLGNIPFIMVQRYNRPRLVRLQRNAERRYRRKETSCEF